MSTEISIKQLSQITEINSDDLILVQTPNATNSLLFSNFVIGLNNTTFGSDITQNTTDIVSLSANVAGLIGADSGVGSVLSKVQSVSSQVVGVSSTGNSTFNELSASSLSANGVEFKGYPAYSQAIYKTRTGLLGAGDTAVDLNLSASANIKENSKLKVSFAIPGTVLNANTNIAFVVQESPNAVAWNDVEDFLGDDDGLGVQGTIVTGADYHLTGRTPSFQGLYTPTTLGTDGIIYIRIMMRAGVGSNFYQNNGGDTVIQIATDASGVSVLLIEEMFQQ
jgi:hypothetical protein